MSDPLPSFFRRGHCVGGKEGAEWTPSRSTLRVADRARRWCAVCPVRSRCLDYAIDRPELIGIYAGTDDDERAMLRDPDPAVLAEFIHQAQDAQ